MARVYAIASAKGGVGKTTTTANLGATLAGAGADVVVIDGDIGMANLGAALGVRPHGATLHDALSGSVEPVAAAYEGPAGLTVVPGDTSLEAFSAADPQQLQSVVDAFDDADYILIDVGAGVSHETSVPLSVADAVILVSTAERDALVDTEKTRQLTDRLGGVVAGAVLTRTDEGAPIEEIVSGTLTAEVLATIPEDEAVRESIAVGEPLLSYGPHSDAAAAYRQLATTLTGIELSSPADPSAVDSGSDAETGSGSVTVDSDAEPDSEPAASTPATDATNDTAPDSGGSGGSAPAVEDDDRSTATAEGGVTIDTGTDSAGDADTEQNGSDDEHNVVNPFAATPKEDVPDQPAEGESKWAEAATGTGGDADSDDIRIDSKGDYDASNLEAGSSADTGASDIEIESTDRDPTDHSDDGIEVQPESDEESVPQDAIPFGGDDGDDDADPADDTSQTTVLGAELDAEAAEAESTAATETNDADNSDDTDDTDDSDDGPLIPDAEETAAANAGSAVDDSDEGVDETEADDDDNEDNEEKRGFFSRLFR
ncbi:septum site-determining protein MinD [Halohasta litchfieldiae]|jgi:septum site-determining protein MinD|uniref:Septum site-determining protein MinD n=1 Tax=Halohasta litchfieldiae TaxID=1073996 RepID=A0A1H6QSE6_9EURY|nr:P-loop NTPase [Halohasta litchfieldiae]ATW88708.1 septum site-determining protein MinD [Halohasta litchfieldiae]SEI46698.1 septum site-determining protein MinD [Halohasta litchfieldiae]